MALIHGIHILAHGDKTQARHIAIDIQTNQRLLVGTVSFYGVGAYAWYSNTLPGHLSMWPQVLFEIDDTAILPICKRDGTSRGFFRIPGPIGSYVTITVQAFVNLS